MHFGPGDPVSAVDRRLRFVRRRHTQRPDLLVQDELEGRGGVAQDNLRGSRFPGRQLQRNIVGPVKPSELASARFVRSVGYPSGELVVERVLDRAVFTVGLAVFRKDDRRRIRFTRQLL